MPNNDQNTNANADADRSLAARAAALSSWAKTDDWSQRTRAARERFLQRFEHEVDPDKKLTPQQRAKRADAARRAYFTSLARRSAQLRRQRADDVEVQDLRDQLGRALDHLDAVTNVDGGESE